MDQYFVVGNPIEHSKSPQIHTLFAKQTGQILEYNKILVELDNFDNAMTHFIQSGVQGLNVTVPFKSQAFDYVDELSERAKLAGAVNTVLFKDGHSCGDNTDGVGLVKDIINQGGVLENKRILVLGAGGAVRGILGPLLNKNPQEIVIVNRSHDKAVLLAQDFSPLGTIKAQTLEQLEGAFDWIINGTSAGLDGKVVDLPASAVTSQTWCYDLLYSDRETGFNQRCRELGAFKCIDGLGMLVEQAAEAFYLWRGVRPETESVIAAIRG